MYRTTFAIWAACLLHLTAAAQGPRKPNSAEIYAAIQKLNVLGSVLYVAAHPDDENTRLIAWLSKEKHYEVTYISLTRGDGGQNLIGTELRELLGVLRSEELLMARSIDGGKQLFSRANDFGYSKTPAETFRIWDKDAVMEDLLLAIRTTQPDVIINRFSHEDKFSTHGHHTASAMLSVEAFDLSGRKDVLPAQVEQVGAWQPERLFFNTSWFFYGSREAFEKMDKSHLYRVDVGTYLPLTGKSVTEIAAEARSQHKCQGFGMLSTRGSSMEYLDHIKGSKPQSQTDLLEGINTTWSRVPGGAPIGRLLDRVLLNYQLARPEASVPELLQAMQLIENLPDGYWKRRKLADIKDIIRQLLGLYLEASTSETRVSQGDTLVIQLEAINRSAIPVRVKTIKLTGGQVFEPDTVLRPNLAVQWKERILIPATTPTSAPYWLLEPWTNGMYSVTDLSLRLLPESPRPLRSVWTLDVDGTPLVLEDAVFYKKGEPAVGEVFAPLEVLPPAFVSFDRQALYSTKTSEVLSVTVKTGKANLNGTVSIQAPKGWAVSPKEYRFFLAQKGATARYEFTIVPPSGAPPALLKATVHVAGQTYSQSLTEINYDHIPKQQVLLPAQLTYTPLLVQCKANKVGYIMGAGDEVAQSLEQIGCRVTQLDPGALSAEKLKKFDCILVGIRAYNTKDALKYANAALLEYVRSGGTLIVQYNTTGELVLNNFAPYALKLGRDRVTEEDAVVTMLDPTHPVFQRPNRITPADFEGWVQERGLYFPQEWAPEFTPLLAMKDSGDTDQSRGSLLVAQCGKGKYIYTGLSFFRQLPSGVPGAMRLLANLMSAGSY